MHEHHVHLTRNGTNMKWKWKEHSTEATQTNYRNDKCAQPFYLWNKCKWHDAIQEVTFAAVKYALYCTPREKIRRMKILNVAAGYISQAIVWMDFRFALQGLITKAWKSSILWSLLNTLTSHSIAPVRPRYFFSPKAHRVLSSAHRQQSNFWFHFSYQNSSEWRKYVKICAQTTSTARNLDVWAQSAAQ